MSDAMQALLIRCARAEGNLEASEQARQAAEARVAELERERDDALLAHKEAKDGCNLMARWKPRAEQAEAKLRCAEVLIKQRDELLAKRGIPL